MSLLTSPSINLEPLLDDNLSGKEEKVKLERLEIETPNSNYSSISVNNYEKISDYKETKIVYPANCLSSMFYHWVFAALWKARKKTIKPHDLGNISASLNAKEFLNQLKPKWYGKYQFAEKYGLFKAVVQANKANIIYICFLIVVESTLDLSVITFFRQILLVFQGKGSEEPMLPLAQLTVIMLAAKFMIIFLFRKSDFQIDYIGTLASVQLDSLIYDKVLKAAQYNNNTSEGELVNFVQIDSEKFCEFLTDSPSTLIVPFQLVFYIYLLFKYFGPAFISGFLVLVVLLIINAIYQKKRMDIQKEYMEAKDERMKTTAQTFNIIKTIKLYSWEKIFIERIGEKRKEEMRLFTSMVNYDIVLNLIYWGAYILLSLVSIITYNLFHEQMDTANMLTSIYIFDSLSDPLYLIPEFITGLTESFVSLKRIERFLGTKDNDNSQVEKLPITTKTAISIDNVDFGIEKEDAIEPTVLLKDIKLNIQKGELIGIVGEVGSGKSCLLNAILNNLSVYSKYPNKNIKTGGIIGYVRQNPWILNDTVRNNILFFKEMDEEKYNKIINLCELNQDIKLLSGGDMTEIGEKGANLSGGQKARLALARCLYSDADIFLFDDPLSALDAYVGMNIFNNVILDYLKGKTIVVVTHALQYISHMDRIIYMKNGEINWFGPSSQLKSQSFFKEFTKNIENTKDNENGGEDNEGSTRTKVTNSLDTTDTEVIRITKDEEQKEGGINFHTWMVFFLYSGGIMYLVYTIFTNVAWKGFEIVGDYFLTYWTSQEHLEKKENYRFLFIYTSISLAGFVFIAWRACLMQWGKIKYNIRMHDELLEKLMKAPVNLFHDTIPRGQILNRLSKDLENSTRLNAVSSASLRVIFQLFGCFVVCCWFNIYSLIIIPLIMFLEVIIVKFYLHGGRDLNRLEGGTRSPMISVFSETIPGVPTIRAYDFEDNFRNKFYTRINTFFKVRLFQAGGDAWFGVRLDLISFILLLFVLSFSLFFRDKFSSQAIGLLLTYSMKLIDYLYNIMERFTTLEKLLTSVERCESFTKIVQEGTPFEDKSLREKDVIHSGKVNFINYSVKYRPNTPLVLKNLNFEIKPMEKIGVVGRTGSGKSTLCLCLFRILEATEGKITIDDVDISTINLEKLRESITVIPQEPTLIEGTLRENIDPGKKFSDLEIQNAMIEVGLEDALREKTLNYKIVEDGINLSIGEKQLICIARALLRKSKVVLMDEATASIDYKTETLIQKSIEKVLKHSTVITIAHRIKTIINYDRILVLAYGELIEFDTPKNLLSNKKGLFSELYRESAI